MAPGGIIELTATLVFSVWTLGTLVSTAQNTISRDLVPESVQRALFLAPNWNFFAPYPGKWDYHLLYRDRLADDSLTEWREADELTETPHRFKWGWNPQMFRMKALVDFNQGLTKVVSGDPDEASEQGSGDDSTAPPTDAESSDSTNDLEAVETKRHLVSSEYLLLLNYVTSKEHHEEAEETQFMIMRSSLRDEEPEPMFISSSHELPEQ